MERMLNGNLKLADVDDLESFCRVRINSYLKRHNMKFNKDQFDDLLAYSMATVWELWETKWNKKGSFSGYASSLFAKRLVDYFREDWGRNGQKISVNSAIPFSAMGTTLSGESDYDKADSAAYVSGLLLR